MVATNSVAPGTGNVSAGTSIFAMVVLEHQLSRVHHELDLVTTPAGDLVAMVHCNNGASEINAWAGLFAEFAAAAGAPMDAGVVFETLFRAALDGAPDGGGLLAFNYLSGEPITGLDEGRPMFLRTPDSRFDLATFIRTQLYAALATGVRGCRTGRDCARPGRCGRLRCLHGALRPGVAGAAGRGRPHRKGARSVNHRRSAFWCWRGSARSRCCSLSGDSGACRCGLNGPCRCIGIGIGVSVNGSRVSTKLGPV